MFVFIFTVLLVLVLLFVAIMYICGNIIAPTSYHKKLVKLEKKLDIYQQIISFIKARVLLHRAYRFSFKLFCNGRRVNSVNYNRILCRENNSQYVMFLGFTVKLDDLMKACEDVFYIYEGEGIMFVHNSNKVLKDKSDVQKYMPHISNQINMNLAKSENHIVSYKLLADSVVFKSGEFADMFVFEELEKQGYYIKVENNKLFVSNFLLE